MTTVENFVVRSGRWFRSSLSVVALTVLAACSGTSEESAIATAKGFVAKKETASAVIELKAALERYPNSAAVRFLLGQTLLDIGNAPAAAIEFEKAEALKYKEQEVQPALARAWARSGQAKKVVERFSGTALADAKARADILSSVASAYWQLEDREQAEKALDAALAADPDQPDALLFRATLQLTSGDAAGARSVATRLVSINPANASALQTLGLAELQLSPTDPSKALELFKKAVAAQPELVSAHSAIIAVSLQRRDLTTAKAQLQEMRKVAPKHFLVGFWDAQLALIGGDVARARQTTQALLKVAPSNAQLNSLAGAIEFHSGSLRLAETHLNKALQDNPNLSSARRMLARTYLRLDQADRALAAIEPLAVGGQDAEALAVAGEVYLHEGDMVRASAAFNKASAIDPADARSRVATALIRIGRGETQAGYSELGAIARDDPTSYASMALFASKIRAKDKAGALAALELLDSKAKAKDKALVPFLRGRLMLATGDAKSARAAFERATEMDPAYLPPALALARLDVAAGSLDAAAERFDKVLKLDPVNGTALLAKAELEARRGGTSKQVLELINAAVLAGPNDVQARTWQVRFLLNTRQYDAALNAAQVAAAQIPDNPAILLLLGDAQLLAGNPRQAMSTFGRLMTLEPKSVVPLLKMSDVHSSQRELDAARKFIERALQIEPTNAVAQRKLIALTLASGKTDEALRVAKASQQRRPDLDYGYLFEGDIEAARGRWPAAVIAYRAALQRSQGSEAAIKLYKALEMAKLPDQAATLSAQRLSRVPVDVRFAVYVGENFLQRDEFQRAEAMFRVALQARQNDAVVLNNLAYSLMSQRKADALEYAERAAKLQPNDPAVLDTLAQSLALVGKLQPAIESQNRAVALQPTNLGLRLTLAKIHLQAGSTDSAKKELDRILVEPSAASFDGREEAKKLRASL